MDFRQVPKTSILDETFSKDRKIAMVRGNIIFFQSVPRSKSYTTKSLKLNSVGSIKIFAKSKKKID